MVDGLNQDLRAAKAQIRVYQDKLLASERQVKVMHEEIIKNKDRMDKMTRLLKAHDAEAVADMKERLTGVEEALKEKDDAINVSPTAVFILGVDYDLMKCCCNFYVLSGHKEEATACGEAEGA